LRLLLRLILLLPALALGAAGLLAVLALEDQPRVTDSARLSAEELARAERVLREHDPRRQPAGGYRTLTLSAEDLDALVGYLAQRFGGAATRVTLGPGEALIAGTRQLPENPAGRYLNLAATLRPRGTELALGDVTVGRLPLPDTLVAWVWGKLQAQLALDPGFRLARESVRDLRVGPDGVRIRYEWRPEILAAARDHLVPPAERERLAAYQQRLHAALTAGTAGRPVSLAAVLADLGRSPPTSDDAVADNRALLLVLAAHALRKDLHLLAPDAPPAPARSARLVLRGRVDLAQHFLGSAGITAAAGSTVSDALGLSKELTDARGGSGFSFTDLVADRAGTRFGELASGSQDSARAWRARLAGQPLQEEDFMPAVDGLPEFLPEAEFRRRYGEVGSPAYRAVLEEIERRVAAAPMYRP
jgi:uncharacterized protein YfiM (DUF2279 family)